MPGKLKNSNEFVNEGLSHLQLSFVPQKLAPRDVRAVSDTDPAFRKPNMVLLS